MALLDQTADDLLRGGETDSPDARFEKFVPFDAEQPYPRMPSVFTSYKEYDLTAYEVGDVVCATIDLMQDPALVEKRPMQITKIIEAGAMPDPDDGQVQDLAAMGEVYYELIDERGVRCYRSKDHMFATDDQFEPLEQPPQTKAAGKRRVSFEADAPKAKRSRRGA